VGLKSAVALMPEAEAKRLLVYLMIEFAGEVCEACELEGTWCHMNGLMYNVAQQVGLSFVPKGF